MKSAGRVSRVQFLQMIGAALPGWALSQSRAASQPSPATDRRRRIATLLETYDSQGIHRTATPVDNASGDWLRRIAEAAGAQARLVPFDVDRVDVRTARLSSGDRTIEGLPFFDGGVTGETGLVGRIGPAGSGADIAFVTLDQAAIASDGGSLAALRQASALRAIVAVTAGGAPGLCPSNAGSFARPFGVPVLQVGSEHQAFVAQLAARGASVTLVASATRTPEQAFNVVATVGGRQAELTPLVVLTPRSAWWQSTAERGGGLACWTEAIRATSAARPARSTVFLATSGHELGHSGLDAFLHDHPDLLKTARGWIHLGDNVGATGGTMRLESSDDGLEAAARMALDESAAPVGQGTPGGTAPTGEARDLYAGGGRCVSLLGSGPRFRSEQDRWPTSTDLDLIARFSQAIATLALTLTRA